MNFGQWLGFFSLILSLFILWEIRQLLLLVFTAVVFTTALNQLVRYLQQQFGLKRVNAIALTLILGLVLTILFFWLIVPPFIEQFQNLIELLPKVWEQVRSFLITFRQQQLQFDWLPSPPSLAGLIQQLQPLGTEVFRNFFNFFSNSFTAVLKVLLVFVLTLMLLANPQRYRRAFLQLFPAFYRQRADRILTASEVALGNWLTGVVINATCIAILTGIGLWALQIKLVLVHALLAGLLDIIPNIGPATSVIFPFMVALLDAPWKVWLILILYFLIQQFESYGLTPLVMAKQVSLLPAVTLIAQIFFAQVFGLLGLLLALPLAVVAKIWIEELLFKDILDKWISQTSKLAIAQSLTEPIIKPFKSNVNDL